MKQILVNSARKALPKGATKQLETVYRKSRVRLVSARYGNPAAGLKVLAVTGTNGKTTTACYLNEILKAAGKKTALFTTAVIEVNGQSELNDLNMTVASSVQTQQFFVRAKKAKVDYVILEVTSHALDQHKLDGVPIEAAIMTNLTQDHLDYHLTMDNYAAAKAKLFIKNPRYIVLNHDDEWFSFYNVFGASEQKITYGVNAEAEARIKAVKLYKKGSQAQLIIDHQTPLELATSLPGKYNVYNMTAAASLAYLLHIKLATIAEGVANLEAVPGRFERVTVEAPYEVVVDYAHSPDALKQLLETVKTQAKNRVILVFGACGDRDKSKRPIMGAIAARLADRIYVTDEESYNEAPAQIRAQVIQGIQQVKSKATMSEIADRREAIQKALSIARRGDIVLITGMGHEQFRIVQGQKIPWNDSAVVREIVGGK